MGNVFLSNQAANDSIGQGRKAFLDALFQLEPEPIRADTKGQHRYSIFLRQPPPPFNPSPFRGMIRQQQPAVLRRQTLDAFAKAFEAYLIPSQLVLCIGRNRAIYEKRLSTGQVWQANGFNAFSQCLLSDSLGYTPGKSHYIFNPILFRRKLFRNSIECFIHQVFGFQTGTPLKKFDQLPANFLVLLPCPISIGVQPQ
jgi:hypothetical protein